MSLSGWERAERSDPYYKACVAATTAGMGIAGNVLAGLTAGPTGGLSFLLVPGGLAAGFVVGYFGCPYLAPHIRLKIEAGSSLSKSEVKSAAEAMGRYAGISSANQALKLLAVARANARSARKATCNVNGEYAARQILAHI